MNERLGRSKVFLSHASEDGAKVAQFADGLQRAGIASWMAPRDVPPGGDYAESITEAIPRAAVFVLFVSEAAARSSHVRREVEQADTARVPILPVRLADVIPSGWMHYFVGGLQWVDAWPGAPEVHLDRLTAALRPRLQDQAPQAADDEARTDDPLAADDRTDKTETAIGPGQAGLPPAGPTSGQGQRREGRRLPPVPKSNRDDAAESRHIDEATLVYGINCARGHFNPPEGQAICRVCGVSMFGSSLSLGERPLIRRRRPSLGTLRLDDGATFVVDRDYVIGRSPEIDDAVRSGQAHPLPVPDPERSASRVHARVILNDWDVLLEDTASANGTFVAWPGQAEWTRVVPGRAVTIAPGCSFLVGSTIVHFEDGREATGDIDEHAHPETT